jgi:Fur family ferric uptake transcriptional regulator
MTRQRVAILEALRSTTHHPDAQWVHAQVRRSIPRISLGTIYRNLDFLRRRGVILQIATKDQPARFDANVRMHGHIACTECDRIDDVPLPRAVTELRDLGPAGFRAVEVKLDFEGVCPDCAARREGRTGGLEDRLATSANGPAARFAP